MPKIHDDTKKRVLDADQKKAPEKKMAIKEAVKTMSFDKAAEALKPKAEAPAAKATKSAATAPKPASAPAFDALRSGTLRLTKFLPCGEVLQQAVAAANAVGKGTSGADSKLSALMAQLAAKVQTIAESSDYVQKSDYNSRNQMEKAEKWKIALQVQKDLAEVQAISLEIARIAEALANTAGAGAADRAIETIVEVTRDLQDMEENFRTEGLTVGPTAASTKKNTAGDKPKS